MLALSAASVLLFLVALPPRPAAIAPPRTWTELAARTVPGAYHIHTTRSDGHGDWTVVATAAARAGLTFVILTDHGDATRPPDPPVYLGGVLVLDGVEISTDDGHYAAIDMPRAPYPLGGAADAVVEDVARLGGFGIAAHPDSPKPALRWTDDKAPIDGIEWLNADTEWRGEPRARLARAGLAYFLRPGPALATIFDRPAALSRWDHLTTSRPVVGLAGADAHGGVGRRAEDTGRSLAGMIGIPSYEASFRTFSNRVVLDRPLSGDAARDARAIYDAIRKGSVFTAVDALAGPALLDLHVESGPGRIGMGGVLPDGSEATIVARVPLPPDAEILLLYNGREVARSRDEIRRAVAGARGAYRVEVRLPGAPGTPPVPWLVSNPVYVGMPPARPPSGGREEPQIERQAAIPPFPWRIEKDASSKGFLRATDHEATLEYKLGDGARNSQFVGLASDLQRQTFRAIDLSLASDRPLRLSVQVRRGDGRRWGRSFYVDPAGTVVRVALSSLRAIDGVPGSAFSSTDLTSILLVIDLANAAPGQSGRLQVRTSALLK